MVPHNFRNSTLTKKYFQNNSANFDNSSFSSISVLQLMRLLLAYKAQIPVIRPALGQLQRIQAKAIEKGIQAKARYKIRNVPEIIWDSLLMALLLKNCFAHWPWA